MNKLFKVIGIILIALGIIFLINNNKYNKLEALVIRTELYKEGYTNSNGNSVDPTYTVFVRYEVNGTEYEEELGVLTGHYEGEKIKVYYNSSDPSEVIRKKDYTLSIITMIIGLAGFIGGIISGRKVK